jgi:hypothetical protein
LAKLSLQKDVLGCRKGGGALVLLLLAAENKTGGVLQAKGFGLLTRASYCIVSSNLSERPTRLWPCGIAKQNLLVLEPGPFGGKYYYYNT